MVVLGSRTMLYSLVESFLFLEVQLLNPKKVIRKEMKMLLLHLYH